jgi:hypothetical protein
VPIPEGRELLRDIHAGICGHHAAPPHPRRQRVPPGLLLAHRGRRHQ